MGQNLLKVVWPLNGNSSYSPKGDQSRFAITEYTYYAIGEDSCVVNGLVKTETGPLGDANNYIRYTYNGRRQVSVKTRYIDGMPYRTYYEYDSRDRLVKETAPDGVVTEYVYNASGDLLRETLISADGTKETVTRTVCDNLGRKVQAIEPAQYNAALDDVANASYSSATAGTKYTYDAAGNILTITDALGNTTSADYDLYGDVLKQTLPNGSYSEYAYDALNRKTKTWIYDHVTQTKTFTQEMAYESRGNWAWVKTYNHLDAVRTAITEDFYDFAGRLVRHINPEGYTTFKTHTIFGAIASETNTMGGRTEYDKLGRLTAVNAPFEGSHQDKTSNTYDKVGNVLSETTKTNKPGAAETTRKTTYTYDAWSRQTMVTLYEGAQPVSYIQTYYNVRGEPVRAYKGLSFLPRVIAVILICTTLCGTAFAASEVDTAADYLVKNGIFVGDGNGNLNLDQSLTRAELAVILTRLDYLSTPGGMKEWNSWGQKHFADPENRYNTFIDIPEWAMPYIEYCYQRGLMAGVGENRFDPQGKVNPQMAATVILRYCGIRETDWSYQTSVTKAHSVGIAPGDGMDGSIILRGTMAVIIYRGIYYGDTGAVPSESTETVNPPQTTEPPIEANTMTIDEMKAEIIRLTNIERVKAGVPELEILPELMNCAQAKAQDFIDSNYYGHNSPVYGTSGEMIKAIPHNSETKPDMIE